jgi:hypothetical protein
VNEKWRERERTPISSLFLFRSWRTWRVQKKCLNDEKEHAVSGKVSGILTPVNVPT